MAKEAPRALDEKLHEHATRPEAEQVEWWRARFEQIATIPRPSARAGALLPELRELAALPKAQRVALTRARVLAYWQLPQDQKDAIDEARRIANELAPAVHAGDEAVLREVVPTLPPEIAERLRAALAPNPSDKPE